MQDDIISVKFEEWTKGLSIKQASISIYDHIRDIPYAIVPEFRDPVDGPAGMLKSGRGSCVPKHFLLGRLFGKLGIPVKYATYMFNWDDPAVKYPPSLREIVKTLPLGTHLACRAYIDGRWALVDATFDNKLKKAGFPVTENWDGIKDTKNAVNAIEETVHASLEERVKFSAEKRKTWTEAQVKAYENFPVLFNNWLETLRK